MTRIAAVRTFGVLLIVFAVGVALRRALILMTWTFEMSFADEGIAAAATAVIASAAYVAGRRLLRNPEGAARWLTEIAVLTIGVALAFGVRGLEPSSTAALTSRQREAFEYLRTAERLEMPTVGFLVARSRGYLAMRILRRSVNADAAFKELLQSGTPAGQLYGLCGLYHSDPIRFSSALPRYRADTGTVEMFWGCIIDTHKVSEIACSENGLRVPRGGAVEKIWEAQRDRDPDICGGALPAIFGERDYNEADALRDEQRADFRRE